MRPAREHGRGLLLELEDGKAGHDCKPVSAMVKQLVVDLANAEATEQTKKKRAEGAPNPRASRPSGCVLYVGLVGLSVRPLADGQ